jgi:hypothetical protein
VAPSGRKLGRPGSGAAVGGGGGASLGGRNFGVAVGILARCQRHGDGQEVLAAVLRLADTEDFARQTVIQALLLWLVALARRAHYIRGGIC